VDAGIADGDAISVHYDPLIAKVVATGADRPAALAALREKLDRTAVFGVADNLPLLRAIAAHPAFAAGDVDTGFVDRELPALTQDRPPAPESVLLAATLALADRSPSPGSPASPWGIADGWRAAGEGYQSIGLRSPAFQRWRARAGDGGLVLDGDGATIRGRVTALGGGNFAVDAGRGTRTLGLIRQDQELQVVGADADEITIAPAWPHERSAEDADMHPASPLPGRVVDLRVKAGDVVARGDVLAVVEGMKMQHAIRAGRAGRIAAVLARAGELVDAEAVLFDIDPA
jgi:3-methylcrotonyl-CoA carboxylase alpha subunit